MTADPVVTPATGHEEQSGAAAPTPPPNRLIRVLRWLIEANVTVVTTLALFTGLLVGAILILVTAPAVLHSWSHFGSAPGAAVSLSLHTIGNAYSAMFEGSIFSPSALGHAIATGSGWNAALTPISETLVAATPLILAGTGVALGFSTGVFNIGAQGQLIAGALAALYVGFAVNLPIGIHLPLVIIAGAVGGGIAGFIPGYLKARTGAHEVITTIMLNYVFLYLLTYLLTSAPFQQPNQSNAVSRLMPSSAQMPHLFGSGLRVNVGLLVALAVTVGASWFTRKSKMGFSFTVVGLNPDAGRTAGMDVQRVTVLVLAISGALAGLAGTATLSGTDFFLSSAYGGNIGFDAITVALLGRNRPVGVLLGSLLFAAMTSGGRYMQATTSIPNDLTAVIQAIIVFCVATPALVKEIFRLREARLGQARIATTGWGG